MASYAWGGQSNGQIPASAMRIALGVYLRADAALALIAMAAAFYFRFGVVLRVTEGFRPLGAPGDYRAGRSNTQWYYWERRQADLSAPSAAYPGGSIHGWALAVDINLNGMTGEMVEWLHTEGRKYGFNWDTTGRPSDEPWHLDFNLPVTASLDVADPEDEEKDEDDMALDDIRLITGTDTGGKFPYIYNATDGFRHFVTPEEIFVIEYERPKPLTRVTIDQSRFDGIPKRPSSRDYNGEVQPLTVKDWEDAKVAAP